MKNKIILFLILCCVIGSICYSLKMKLKFDANCFQNSKSLLYHSFHNTITSIGIATCILCNPMICQAGMLTFPLQTPLKNNIVLMRAGECQADARQEIQTNAAKKLRQDNGLTLNGEKQVIESSKKLIGENFIPSYIYSSNTERAYETATLLGHEFGIGQNRIVPEFTFLDARAAGIYEGKSTKYWDEIHVHDREEGIKYKPPPNSDGTLSDSVSDVLVRGNQILSTLEGLYSGENIVVVSPDSEFLSIMEAAMANESPDTSLPNHSQFYFNNGETRMLRPFIKPNEKLYAGNTFEEASEMTRKTNYNRYLSESRYIKQNVKLENWFDLWKLSIDHSY